MRAESEQQDGGSLDGSENEEANALGKAVAHIAAQGLGEHRNDGVENDDGAGVLLETGVFKQQAQVSENGQDNHTGHPVSDGDKPESGSAYRLPGREALWGRRGAARGRCGRGRSAVGIQPHILRAVADNQRQGNGGGQDYDRQSQGHVLPANGIAYGQGFFGERDAEAAVDAQVNQGDNQESAAAAHKVGPPHSGGHTPGKPVVDGGHHRHPAANALAQRHYHIG